MGITKKGAIILLAMLMLPALASAEILLSQTESIYNVGDDFEITITVTASKFTSDFFTATLVCEEGEEIELFKSPYTIKEGEEKEIIISTNLGNFLVGERNGKCHLGTSYNTDQANSQIFQILSDVDVTLNIEGATFDPGAKVKVFGNAVKSNNKKLTGFVELSVEKIGFSVSGPVTEGVFELNFTIPNNAFSGSYEIKATVYEKDDAGEIMNQGNGINTIKIKQIPTEIDIAFQKETATPSNDFIYTIIIYDQAGETIESDASIILNTPSNSQHSKNLVRTNKVAKFETQPNSTAGYWTIKASAGNLQTEKTFLMEEVETVEFKLEGQVLTVLNTGNVPYSKSFEIFIGGVKEIKEIGNVPIPVGSSKKYKLLAPDGDYNVEIGTATERQNLGSTFLTGRAISVEDIGNTLSQNLIVLISLVGILLIAIVGLYIYRKISKNRKGEKIPDQTTPYKKPAKNTPPPNQSTNIIDKGEKQESEIISIKIKNGELLEKDPSALKALDGALWKATEAGAKIYTDGNFRTIVLNQALTKEKDNSLTAISIAQTIERMLKEHNKRATNKIDFGIGISHGNLIVESKEGKFRFISTDNSITASKRISQDSNSDVLISEILHRKTAGKVRAEKIKDQNLWKVVRITDRSQHKGFIKNFTRKTESK